MNDVEATRIAEQWRKLPMPQRHPLKNTIFMRKMPPDDPKGTVPFVAVTEEANLFVVWLVTSRGDRRMLKWHDNKSDTARDDSITFAVLHERQAQT